jgi:hypothetical protein
MGPMGNKRRHTRGRAQGRSAGHLHSVGPPDDPLVEFVRTAGEQMLEVAEPLAVEARASELLAMYEQTAAQARAAGTHVPDLTSEVLAACRRLAEPESLVLAVAIAAVAAPPHDREAESAVAWLRAQGVRMPGWVDALGASRFTRAWRAGDVFGDQESLIFEVVHEGQPPCALVVLVDHNLEGQAKDAWLADDADGVVELWAKQPDPAMTIEAVPVDEACRRLRDAMAASDLYGADGELRTEDFAQHRALVWAWLRRAGFGPMPGGGGDRHRLGDTERAALIGDFLASPDAEALAGSVDADAVERLARHLVDLRCDYGAGDPLRWSPIVAGRVLLDLAPRKSLIDAADIDALPIVAAAFVRHAARVTGLDERAVQDTVEAIEELADESAAAMRDPRAAGPAKQLLERLLADGVDLDDEDAIAAAVDAINAQGGLDVLVPPRVSEVPVDPAVLESAAAAPILARFDALAEFYRDGRKLTTTGNPTLADARALVTLLDTGDAVDPVIRDRVFTTRSADDLLELQHTLRWAQAAGVLRKQKGRQLATKTWAALHDPWARFDRAAAALERIGPLSGYQGRRGRGRGPRQSFRVLDEFVDALVGHLLASIARRPATHDALLDAICSEADREFEWRQDGYWADPAHRRAMFGRKFDRVVHILELAGLATRAGAVEISDAVVPGRTRLTGGTIGLTPAASWWLGHRS